jgi:hypothetical protein
MKYLATIWLSLSLFQSAKAGNIEDECHAIIRGAVYSSDFWVKVHAIEFLSELGYNKEAKQFTKDQLADFDSIPQKRIGYWRCSYRLAGNKSEKNKWLNKIRDAYMDPNGPDRIHAVESLAKLNFSLKGLSPEIVARDLNSDGALAWFTLWGNALPKENGRSPDFDKLFPALDQSNDGARKIAAYSLSYLGNLPKGKWDFLASKALSEPRDSEAYPYLLSAAYILSGSESDHEALVKVKQRLDELKDVQNKSGRIELCRAIAAKGNKLDLQLLTDLLHLTHPVRIVPRKNAPGEVRAWNDDIQTAAAYAILKIYNREKTQHNR